jgi:outer membrane lipoprotein carrier protein
MSYTQNKTRIPLAAIFSAAVLILIFFGRSIGAEPKTSGALDDILDRLERRYAVNDFYARFDQELLVKAMDITDTGFGNVQFKRPGMMRWEYEKPEKQIIVTDGATLWIYKPSDRQVMVGRASEFFGDGKGASFLSDIRLIRKSFNIRLIETTDAHHRLKLFPLKPSPGLLEIDLSVSRATFLVEEVVTYNEYRDESRISFSDYRFDQGISRDIFRFEIPPGTDILNLDQEPGALK